jgi:glycosyltransferase involved in cell wall biosynthesis
MSLVSVIIPAYNAAKFIGGAIESVFAQSVKDFEIIVVDDGSTDGTGKVVESYLCDSRVRYLRQANRGLPGTRNAGATASTGEFLAFLDADDFFAPNALETMRRKFEESGAAWLNIGVLKLEGGKRTVRHPRIPEGDLLLAILENDFITRSPFYPRNEFFSIGMYDEEIRMREDWDMNIRMIEARRPFTAIDEPLYHYSRTQGSITTANHRTLYSYTEKVLHKHHKRLADIGDDPVARIYSKNMWDLARRYFYEIRDPMEGLRCVVESMRYDLSLPRLLHPLFHRAGVTQAQRRQ